MKRWPRPRCDRQYRVLRRLGSRSIIQPYDGSETRLGLFVDVEATGLDPSVDEIVELAMVPFTYSLDGRIFSLSQVFEKLRAPSRPLIFARLRKPSGDVAYPIHPAATRAGARRWSSGLEDMKVRSATPPWSCPDW